MVEGVSTRDQIRDQLTALAEQQLARWDEFADKEFTSNELGFDYTSRQGDYNGHIITLARASIPGLTLEQHRTFRDNLAEKQS